MKDFLPGSLAVGKKRFTPLTLHATFAQGCCDALSNAEDLRTYHGDSDDLSCSKYRRDQQKQRSRRARPQLP
jgi:hypothetical protein